MPRLLGSLLALLCASDALANVVLIAPFPPGTVRPGDAAQLDDVLRARVADLPGVTVQAREETEGHLKAMSALGMSCHPDETRCLVQLGTLAGAARIISTQAVPAGDAMRVTLRLIEVSGANELRRIDGRVERATLDHDVEALATGLLLPAQYRGSLIVDAGQSGAKILLDGKRVGTTPVMEPIEARSGRRTVRIEKEGFAPVEQVVIIPFRESTELRVTLRPADGASAATTFQERTRVLVLDFLAEGAGLPNARTLSSVVAVELARDPGLDVLSGTDVDQLVAASEAGLEIDCQDTSCLTDLAGALDVPLIVHGDVGLLGSVLVVHLDVFDAERVETVARTSVENVDRDALSSEVKVAARRLLDDARRARPELVKGDGPPPVAVAEADTGPDVVALAGWGTAAVGAAVLVVGGVLAGYFGATYLQYENTRMEYVEGGETDKELGQQVQDSYDRYNPYGETLLPVGWVLTGVGGAIVLVGVTVGIVGSLE